MGSQTHSAHDEPDATAVWVNDRAYRLPRRPVVVICLDGCSDEYLDAALSRRVMPNLERRVRDGFRGVARTALPSLTNINNASIVTGVPASVHGICGNFFLDPETGDATLMNSAGFLRAPTILAAVAAAGRRVAMVTAKEKLRDLLSHELQGIAFSAEYADRAQSATHGIEAVEDLVGAPTPQIYSADASLYVLRAGVALLQRDMADFLYLSLTDYVQHTYVPRSAEALDFFAAIDVALGNILETGAIAGLTADHGMNEKQTPDGRPNVVYLQTLLDAAFGSCSRVILPITDPYVKHHGSLGSFATVYLADPARTAELSQWLLQLDGITEVYDRATAARELELPADRIGDLVVLSGRDMTIGRTPGDHDLSALDGGLRSHGGRCEAAVPFIVTEPLNDAYRARGDGDIRNFDIFDFVLNGTRTDISGQ